MYDTQRGINPIHWQEIKQLALSVSKMAQMLKLSDKGFKIVIINILKEIVEKVCKVHEHTGNIKREMETIRKSYIRIKKHDIKNKEFF